MATATAPDMGSIRWLIWRRWPIVWTRPVASTKARPAPGPAPDAPAAVTAPAKLDTTAQPPVDPAELRAQVWSRVQLARNVKRPHTLELIEAMASDIVELHGDRLFGDDAAIVGGFCRL